MRSESQHNLQFPSPWRRGPVVSSPPANEETGAMGREIESRPGIGGVAFLEKKFLYRLYNDHGIYFCFV
jgi:hypothetical protein